MSFEKVAGECSFTLRETLLRDTASGVITVKTHVDVKCHEQFARIGANYGAAIRSLARYDIMMYGDVGSTMYPVPRAQERKLYPKLTGQFPRIG